MNSATHPASRAPALRATSARPNARPPRHHRPSVRQPKSHRELSSFEKIVGPCLAPAFGICEYLDETSIYFHDKGEQIIRNYLSLLALAEMAVGLSVGSVLWCVLKGVALVLRKVQRPKYYPQERLRRQALARERRRVRRRTTINAAPTPEELLAQWAKVKGAPAEMIRFGSMLCDLEAYVDNSLLRNENGEIVGRNPGIRGWLNANCQPLAVRYKTVMGYKAMAEKYVLAIDEGEVGKAYRGLGWVVCEDAELGHFIYHGASNRSFRGMMGCFPEQRRTFVYFFNGTSENYNVHGPMTQAILGTSGFATPWRSGKALPVK